MTSANTKPTTALYPDFQTFDATHVPQIVSDFITYAEARVAAIMQTEVPTWETVLTPLEEIERRKTATWGTVSHLFSVKNSDALRVAYEQSQPKIVEFDLALSQNKTIFEKVLSLKSDQNTWNSYKPAQKRIVDNYIRDARLSGLELEGAHRSRFNEIIQRQSELSTKFTNNVLDATKQFELVLKEPLDIAGLPQALLEQASDSFNKTYPDQSGKPNSGPWRITLDQPSAYPFISYCENRAHRETVYRALMTRASRGELDNQPIINETLSLRQEEAELLGYRDYANLSIASKMANEVSDVHALLEEMRGHAFSKAKQEFQDLQAFAASKTLVDGVKHWDVAFLSEKQKQDLFGFSDEDLRPYFALDRVLTSLFEIVSLLFNVKVTKPNQQPNVWDPAVTYYDVTDMNDQPIAGFYLDPFSRPENKRGGAWMRECVNRGLENGIHTRPIAYLICNFSPASDTRPSLLKFSEVKTLFHEFGHGLQHMLTEVDYVFASGINGIEWDAVELPSQFMENWCYERNTIAKMAIHYQDGHALPEDLYHKMIAAKNYLSGSATTRQLLFGLTDLRLHENFVPSNDRSVFDVYREVAAKTMALAPLEEDRFLCTFGHIFAGGYAAGYYSYKWAEVLSADAFAAFEESDLENPDTVAQVGARFRKTILAEGGGRAPMEVFIAFRGREPKVEALLRQQNLLPDENKQANKENRP